MGNNMDQKVCRTCLAESDGSIFKTITLAHKEVSLVEMLYDCTDLKVTEYDEISLNICDICTEEIIRSYEFRKKSWESHNFLVRLLEESRIGSDSKKYEPADEADLLLGLKEEEIDVDRLDESKIDIDPIKCEAHNFLVRRLDESRIDIDSNKCEPADEAHLLLGLKEEEIDVVQLDESRIVSDPIKCEAPSPIEPVDEDSSPGFEEKEAKVIVPSINQTSARGAVKCKLCDEAYVRRSLMVQHLHNEHNILEYDKYECQYCKKSFDYFSYLKKHIRTMHEPDKVKYKCHHCGEKLKNRTNLRIHMRRHTGERPYKCDFCEYSATHQATITSHMRTHTNERPYECDVCGKLFRSSSSRASHLKAHSTEKPYECKICSKKFKRNEMYKAHIVIHDPNKYIKCGNIVTKNLRGKKILLFT